MSLERAFFNSRTTRQPCLNHLPHNIGLTSSIGCIAFHKLDELCICCHLSSRRASFRSRGHNKIIGVLLHVLVFSRPERSIGSFVRISFACTVHYSSRMSLFNVLSVNRKLWQSGFLNDAVTRSVHHVRVFCNIIKS